MRQIDLELNEWAAAADDVIWLDQGRVRFKGDRNQWLENLPCTLWEGCISMEQFRSCSEQTTILFRELPEEGVYVKIISETRPFPVMKPANPTMEEFVCKYSFKGSI